MPIPRIRRRQHWYIVAIAFALTAGAATASAFGAGADRSREPAAAPPASAPASAAAAADTHPMKFGLDYAGTLFYESPAQVRASLEDAVDVGAKWVRIDLPWEVIQPDDAYSYQWSRFDTIANTAHSLGLSIDAILDSTAYWDADHACKVSGVNTEFCPPADMGQFADFAAAAVRRYQNDGVGAWEIWNEPNLSARWWPSASASGYARMLTQVAQAIRGVDPHAFILLGGMAGVVNSTSLGYIAQNTFLQELTRIPGALADVNAISYHPFSAPTLPSVAPFFQAISTAPGNLLSVLQASGHAGIQIWITESGYGFMGPDPDAELLQQQAAYAANLLETVIANPNVAADFWFSDEDMASEDLYWGLRDGSGRQRPVLNVVKSTIAACHCSTG